MVELRWTFCILLHVAFASRGSFEAVTFFLQELDLSRDSVIVQQAMYLTHGCEIVMENARAR